MAVRNTLNLHRTPNGFWFCSSTSDLLNFNCLQGRGGGRAPGEDAGAEQRTDGQERREVCGPVTEEPPGGKEPRNVADERRVTEFTIPVFLTHFSPVVFFFSFIFRDSFGKKEL